MAVDAAIAPGACPNTRETPMIYILAIIAPPVVVFLNLGLTCPIRIPRVVNVFRDAGGHKVVKPSNSLVYAYNRQSKCV